MAKKRSTKPNRTMIWVVLSAAIFLIVISLISIIDLQQKNLSNMQQFKQDYPRVAEQHVFRSASTKVAIEKLEKGTGVVFIGFKECPWCQYLVAYVDKAAKAENLASVTYLNIRQDRTDNSDNYKKIVSILEPYLEKDEQGSPRVYVPHVVAVKNGKIVDSYRQEEMDPAEAKNGPASYWTDDRTTKLDTRLRELIRKVR